jgi:hypothetical protein
MNETAVLNFLKKQTKAVLLDLLSTAFHEMNSSQKRAVFGNIIKKAKGSGLHIWQTNACLVITSGRCEEHEVDNGFKLDGVLSRLWPDHYEYSTPMHFTR